MAGAAAGFATVLVVTVLLVEPPVLPVVPLVSVPVVLGAGAAAGPSSIAIMLFYNAVISP